MILIEINIIFLGSSGVGKTSLFKQYFDGEFEEAGVSTIGVDFNVKYFTFSGEKIKVSVTDTAGQEQFDSINVNYLRKADGVILVYDITSDKSFKLLNKWLGKIEGIKQQFKMVILGNKCDLDDKREVAEDEGKKYAAKHNAPFFEVSAKGNINVQQAFEQVIKDTYEMKKEKLGSSPQNVTINKTGNDTQHKKKKCCKDK